MKKIYLGLLIVFFSSVTLLFSEGEQETEVNIYSHRHYDVDQQLYDQFEQETGITVNVIQAKSDELIARLEAEGAESPADILMTVDVGRLYRAQQKGLLQPLSSASLSSSIPASYRHPDGYWFGLTRRARVITYHKDRVSPSDLNDYEDLTGSEWQGRIVIRSSGNIYNQSLMAGMIATQGEAKAAEWAAGIVANMARSPEGNDRDQMKAVAAGIADVAIVNTYYVGLLLNSSNPDEVKVGEQIGVFFPNQSNRGAHVNISGAGITASAKNVNSATKLLEFLASKQAQETFTAANHEFPVNPQASPSALLASWGEFKADAVELYKLGEENATAVKVFDQVGWR